MRLAFGAGEVDLDRRELRTAGGDGETHVVGLTTKETALLAYLAQRPGEVVGWDELHREIWGHHPAVVSRAAYFTWRRLVHKLEVEPDRPVHLVSHHGGGVAFVPRSGADRADTVSVVSAPAGQGTRATNVGRALDRGFGRDADHQRFDAIWQVGARLVTVVGPGGVGKTRFARDVAERLLQHGQVWWCDAAEAAGAEDIEAQLTRIIDAPTAIDARRALDARGAVVVIDDVDRVAAALGAWCRAWLADTRALRFVLTGRARTNQPGEAVIALGPLDDAAGAALYVDRVLRLQPDWDLAAWYADVAALVRRLDGLPLAIELAAARAGAVSPRELLGLLDDRFSVLSRRGDPSRHGSLWAAMEASWAPLTPEARRGFARLAVFRGGFDLPAAEAVLAEVCGGRLGAVDLLDELCARSLVYAVPASAGALRFGLYETLRAYAEAKLDAAIGDGVSERVAAQQAHAAWYGDLALALLDATSGAGAPTPDARIAPDRDNLAAVWARRPGDSDDPHAAACAGALVWLDRGRSCPAWQLGALDHAVAGASGQLAVILRVHRALARLREGGFDGAWADVTEARRLAEALPADAPWRARADVAVAQVAYHRGEPDVMFDALDRAGARLPRGARRLAAKVDEMRVLALLDLGRLAEARHVALRTLGRLRGPEAATGVFDPSGDRFACAVVSCHLACVELALGRSAAAERLLDEAQATFRAARPAEELGHAEVSTRVLLGIAEMESGAYARAEGTLRAALTAYERLGTASGVAQAQHNLGIACLALGRADEGRALLHAALDADRADGNRRAAPLAHLTLAMDAVSRGDRADAEASLAAVGAPGQRRARVHAACVRAVSAARFADPAGAASALAALDDVGGPFEGESGALVRAVRAYVRGDDPAEAAVAGDDRFHVVRWVRGLAEAGRG